MKTPIFVRSLSEKERGEVEDSLRSKDAFTMRRAQILLASCRGEHAPKIARNLGCAPQTVRDAIHDFNERGMDALAAKSSCPKRTRDAFDERSAEALREMMHRSPREFGYESSLWTLAIAAEAAFEEGITHRRVSGETIRATLWRLLRVRWQRAKRWITSPEPLYERKKAARPTDGNRCHGSRVGHGFPGRVLVEPGGFAHPQQLLRERRAPAPRPAVGRQRRPRAESRLLLWTLPARDRRHLAALRGRQARKLHNHPVPRMVPAKARRGGQEGSSSDLGQRQLARLQKGQALARKNNRRVKESGRGVRVLSCLLPKQSPWLNAIEPKWVHGKRKVVEPDGLLGAYELADRVCRAFDCPHYEHLSVPQKVA